jgi:dienelactone hydrolase
MGDRYIMAATVDQPLQGTRIRDGHKLCLPTAKLNDQPTFGMDCHSNVMKTALSFTSLVDVFETCVFGKQADGLVDKWGVIGFSMGGYSALQAAASGK